MKKIFYFFAVMLCLFSVTIFADTSKDIGKCFEKYNTSDYPHVLVFEREFRDGSNYQVVLSKKKFYTWWHTDAEECALGHFRDYTSESDSEYYYIILDDFDENEIKRITSDISNQMIHDKAFFLRYSSGIPVERFSYANYDILTKTDVQFLGKKYSSGQVVFLNPPLTTEEMLIPLTTGIMTTTKTTTMVGIAIMTIMMGVGLILTLRRFL